MSSFKEDDNPNESLNVDESKTLGTNNTPTTTVSSTEVGKDFKTQENGNSGLSKKQLRKLKKREKWLAVKPEKRKQEHAKRKKRYADARSQGISLGPSRKALKMNTMKNSKCQIHVVVDCSFDQLMSEKDVMKLVKQLQSCYSVNRRAKNPLQFYVCGISGQTKERLDTLGDCKNWDVYFTPEKYTEKFEKSQLVYLSSDSDNVVTELENDKIYVIGGLVDHNHHKGLCHRLATENDIAHAKLPISEYIQMKSRKVLTVNHVFEILLRYTESKDWRYSLCQVIPERKGVTPLSCKANSNGSNNSEVSKDQSTCETEPAEQSSEKLKSEENLSNLESAKSLQLVNVDI